MRQQGTGQGGRHHHLWPSGGPLGAAGALLLGRPCYAGHNVVEKGQGGRPSGAAAARDGGPQRRV